MRHTPPLVACGVLKRAQQRVAQKCSGRAGSGGPAGLLKGARAVCENCAANASAFGEEAGRSRRQGSTSVWAGPENDAHLLLSFAPQPRHRCRSLQQQATRTEKPLAHFPKGKRLFQASGLPDNACQGTRDPGLGAWRCRSASRKPPCPAASSPARRPTGGTAVQGLRSESHHPAAPPPGPPSSSCRSFLKQQQG